MLQNTKVTAFTISELLRENQQGGRGGGGKITPPRLGLRPFAMFILAWFVGSLLFVIFHLGECLHHEHCLNYTYSYFFKTKSFKKASSAW